MNNKLVFTTVVVAALVLGLDAYAITCNRKAQTHQAKAGNVYMMVTEFHRIPSQEEEEFVLCMLEEREDKEDFRRRVRKLKDEKRNAEARQARERAEAAEQQQRDQQLANQRAQEANQRAQEEAARETQAERRIVSIQGTGGYDGYYLGRVTSDDVVIVEPLQGHYSSVGIFVGDNGGHTDVPRPRFSPGEKIPNLEIGGYPVKYNTADSVRINVRQAGAPLPPGRLGYAQLFFQSADSMQIRVTILCVHGVNSIPCKDRDQLPSVVSSGG